jgi:acetyl esterase/lipase
MTRIPENLMLRLMRTQLAGWHKGTVAQQRARQERSARFFRVPEQAQWKAVSGGGIPGEWITSPEATSKTLLYLHGGAYALGSVNTHRALVARIAVAAKCSALAIDYRLAPENPFPAALEDSLAAYNWLIAEGLDPSHIILAGDSAGGGLAIATLLKLRDAGEPLPAGAFCFSPWLDLTLSSATLERNEKLDPMLKRSILEVYAKYYIGIDEDNNPYISPLQADLRGLPSIHLQTGSNEVLLDDSIRFYNKAQQAGVDISMRTWDDMFHVFQLIPFLPQAAEALQQVAEFMNRITGEQIE